MSSSISDSVLILAGGGTYPALLAAGARRAGVRRIVVAAVRGMAGRDLARLADETVWFGLGELRRFLEWAGGTGIRDVVLAGQITPVALFRTRFDALARELLQSLRAKHAHSIYGEVSRLLTEHGLRVLPSSCFMEDHLPTAGILSARSPDARETADIEIGHALARRMSDLDIGQTVVIKDGMVLAVEAFEGSNDAIRRGARLGGRGAVVVKVAKAGHDMRFDIPVIGARTLPVLRRARISAISFQAGRTILLDRDELLAAARKWGIAIVAVDSGLPAAPVRPD